MLLEMKLGKGVLVSVSSMSAIAATPYWTAYAASKHAVRGFSAARPERLRRIAEVSRLKTNSDNLVPHELRAPVMAIKGHARLLEVPAGRHCSRACGRGSSADGVPLSVGGARGRAYAALVVANLLWGSLAPAGKALVGAVGPAEVAFVRGVCACLVLGALSWLLHGPRPLRAALVRPREVGLLGLFSLVGSSLLGQSALQTLPASLYAVLLATSPLALAVLAIGRGTTGARAVLGALVALAGVAVTVGLDDPGGRLAGGADPRGLAFAAGNVATIVATQLWGRRTAAVGEPIGTTAAAAAFALPVLLAAALAQGGFRGVAAATTGTILLLGYVGVFCTAATFGLLFAGLRHVSAARSAAFWYLVPPFGIFLSWLLLDEPLTPGLWLGGALVLGGVALAQSARDGHDPLELRESPKLSGHSPDVTSRSTAG